MELVTPTFPGVNRDEDGAMDEADNEAEGCGVVANEPVVVEDTVDTLEAAEATQSITTHNSSHCTMLLIIRHTQNTAVIIHLNAWTQFRIVLTLGIERQIQQKLITMGYMHTCMTK